jgi:pyridoxal phosphate enzyme (YggS family)
MQTIDRERLKSNLDEVRRRMAQASRRAGRAPEATALVAVTKTVDAEVARALHELGVRDLAENRPQALWEKADKLPYDVRWHLIGRLQTNKVRRTASRTSMIHSVDRTKLALALSDEAVRLGRRLSVCLEVNVTGESTKQGFSPQEVRQEFASLKSLPNLDVVGLMTMARFEDDPELCRPTFASLRELAEELAKGPTPLPAPLLLSMGMSNDFEQAIAEGATHVRIGSALFEGISG